MEKPLHIPLLSLILLTSFASPASIIISPALPEMAKHFSISDNIIKQLITIFLTGFALGQLIYPPFSNAFGRKVSLYIGISIFLFACLLSFISIYYASLKLLLISRFLMGVGTTSGMHVSFTMIYDIYPEQEARKKISYSVLAFAVIPAVAILAGGFIVDHLGWDMCFYLLLPYGILILIISVLLPETLKTPIPLNLNNSFRGYAEALKNPYLLLFSLVFGVCTSATYLIAVESPFIAIDNIGISEQNYGIYLLFAYCGQLLGSVTSGKISKNRTGFEIMNLGIFIAMSGIAIMLICFIYKIINIYTLIIPLFLVMMGTPMVYSHASVYGLQQANDKANGVTIQLSIGILCNVLSLLFITSFPPHAYKNLILPLALLASYILTIKIYLIAYKFQKNSLAIQNSS